MDLNVYRNISYRYDIQGVRAIGAILIMFYHIWFNKVSGGVDVFFVVSGYFMSGMLVKSYLKNGKIKPFEFWGRIIRRVSPLAYTVIAATLILGYFFMPPYLWRGSINEVLTSALHFENWQLIRVGTDYLASSNPPSPLQQFWALSLQIQFYFILPFVLSLGVFLSRLFGSYKAIFIVVALVIVASFGFSIWYTYSNPSAAYFHTGARAWEFFIGVATFIASPFIVLSSKVSRILMWIGGLLILSVGVIIPNSATYPGYVAALPVAAAVSIMIAGDFAKTGYVYKILSSKILVYIGGMSFSLYLWHWPIFIYFQHYSGANPGEINFTEGFFIIVLAFVFSIISNLLIEKPFSKIKKTSTIAPYFIGVLFFLPVFLSSYYVRSELILTYDEAEFNDYINGSFYNGDSAYVQNEALDIRLTRFISLRNDLTNASLNGCSTGIENGKISFCEFGNKSKEESILLVGGSRLAHWEPFFSYLGRKYSFKVVTATINSCSFGYHPSIENNVKCQNWNNNIIEFISNMNPKPKIVVVNSSRLDSNGEYTPSGYVKNIKEVLSFGIPVLGIRTAPKFDNPNLCLWRNSDDTSKCATNYSSSLEDKNPILKIKENEKLDDLYPIDFTKVICRDGICPAYFDGYPGLRDGNHFTKSYILYLTHALEKALNYQVDGFTKFLND
jgi:peptidoglycan/LPS O-acetylase OafA/YrhL